MAKPLDGPNTRRVSSDGGEGTRRREKRKGRPENPRALSGHSGGATFKLGVHKRDRSLDGALYSQIRRVEQVRTLGQLQRGVVATHVARVARLDVGDQAVHVGMAAMRERILEPAFGADMDAGGHEYLRVGIGHNDRADVAPVEDGAARLRREIALALDQCVAHDLMDGDARRQRTHGFAPQRRIAQDGVVEATGGERVRFMVRIAAGLEHGQTDRAIEQAGVEHGQAVMHQVVVGLDLQQVSCLPLDFQDHS